MKDKDILYLLHELNAMTDEELSEQLSKIERERKKKFLLYLRVANNILAIYGGLVLLESFTKGLSAPLF